MKGERVLTIKINNPEIEHKFKEYAKEQKQTVEDIANEAMKFFLESKKNKKLKVKKLNPKEHIVSLEYKDDNEDLSDVKLYENIKDSAQYIHNLRRKRAE